MSKGCVESTPHKRPPRKLFPLWASKPQFQGPVFGEWALQSRDLSSTLEARALALGTLIGVSGDGVEKAEIRPRRDVVLALKVF
jgi:hypothetical protein